METKVNYAVVGTFVVALSAALIAGMLWLASGGSLHRRYDTYLSMVNESVSGLSPNAPVKYRGVDVGKVSGIELDKQNPELVRLTFAIEHGTPIKQDTVGVLRTQGLTGIAYVELSGGSAASPMLEAVAPEPYPVIRTTPSLSARLENVLTNALTKLDTASDTLNKLFSNDNVSAFKSTLADLSSVTHTLAARKDAIDRGVTGASRTFENSARISAQLDRQLGPAMDRIGRSADALRHMADETAHTSASVGKTVDSTGADIRHFTADALPELQRLISDMSILTVSLRHLVEETERNPRGFLFGRQPVPEGPGESPQGAPREQGTPREQGSPRQRGVPNQQGTSRP